MQQNVFLHLEEPIRSQLQKIGIEVPSDIQGLAFDHVRKGENVLLIAPTGSGKTFACILPVLNEFLSLRRQSVIPPISILYVTPLRALNRDILRRIESIGAELKIRVDVRHSDTPASSKIKQSRSPPDILITTPETLQAILPGRRMRSHLKNVRWLIVDEIHELAADERGAQLSVALERLEELAGRRFQRIGLSATVGDEGKVGSFLVGNGRQVAVVRSDETRRFDVWTEHVPPSQADSQLGERFAIPTSSVSRIRRILELTNQHSSTLIFTNTREHAEALASRMAVIAEGLPLRVHHGSLSRELREEAEQAFQSGAARAIICTSSLELGIDIGRADFVIQYMSPRQATRLVHRVGRSGHRVSGTPRGCILTSLPDDTIESAVIARNAKQGILEPVELQENSLDVLAHQIVGLALEMRRVSSATAYDLVKRSSCYSNLDFQKFLAVVEQLEAIRVVRLFGDVIAPRYPRAFKYYYENLSVIPDVKHFTVFDFNRKRRIGTLDQEFVARRCRSGTEFIMHGDTWKVIAVDEEKLKVEVENVTPSLNAIPSWEGEIIPVPYAVATEVGRIRRLADSEGNLEKLQQKLTSELGIDTVVYGRFLDALKEHAKTYPVPSDVHIVVEKFEHWVIIHACYGNQVNETLALALSATFSSFYGASVASQVDPYRIALMSPVNLDQNIVAKQLTSISPDDLQRIIEHAVDETDNFAWRHWHVARRFGIVERSADYKLARARLLVKALRESVVNEEAKREIFLEKLDLPRAKDVLQRVQAGQIRVSVAYQKGVVCSPFALPIVDKLLPHDLLRPAVPTRSLTEIVKHRLLSSTIRLVCAFNGDWHALRTVADIREKVVCPRCHSSLIAVTYPGDLETLRVVRKRKRQQPLRPEEEDLWKRAWYSASLVQTAGKKAILALAARGVGPLTATRILRRRIREEDDFYAEILKAERQYARTRSFWD